MSTTEDQQQSAAVAVEPQPTPDYPGVADRVKAMFIDGMVLIGFAIGFTFLFEMFEQVPDNARLMAFVFVFLLYDPLMTSLLGGTIGHFAMGLRVRRMDDHSRKIMLPVAMIRFLVKSGLGWISLLTIGANPERRAMHDFLAESIVLYQRSLI